MWNAFWIFVGGGLGSLARWGASGFIARHWGEDFPVGTLVVNITGSLVIGFLATLTGPDGRWLAPSSLRIFLMFGVLGGYTTFSSFSLQTLTLAQDGQWFRAALNAVLSLGLCLTAVWLGHTLAVLLNSARE
ncbi:MAG: fluoride efflux transporter CrcB [Verrucomicrobia bacterium]|nr:fluoride efflux transporter CrcB [Verrucomicrobiota bacterium]